MPEPATLAINQHTQKTSLDWLFNMLIQPSSGAGSGVSPATHEQFGMSLDLIRQAVVEITNVVNNVTTTVPGKVLDARQGKVLADTIQAEIAKYGVANGLATLGADGKIPSAQIPSLAIVDVFPVATEAAMLALDAQQGDMAIRSDTNQVFILSASPASTLENWIELSALEALVDAAIADLAGTGRTAETVYANAQAIALLNGDEETEGSVAKTAKDAVDPVKGEGWVDESLVDHEERIEALETNDALQDTDITCLKVEDVRSKSEVDAVRYPQTNTVKASVEGIGEVTFPKDAKGIPSIKVTGSVEAENLAPNGDLGTGDTTGWNVSSGTLSIVNGNIKCTSDGTYKTSQILPAWTPSVAATANDKFWVTFKVRIDNVFGVLRLSVQEFSDSSVLRSSDITIESNPESGVWYTYNDIITLSANTDFNRLVIRVTAGYVDKYAADGKSHEVKGGADGIRIVKITNTIFAELSASELATAFPEYWDGMVGFGGTGCVVFADKDANIVGSWYFTGSRLKSNVDVKDEISFKSNAYYLTNKVGDGGETLDPYVDEKIPTSGTPVVTSGGSATYYPRIRVFGMYGESFTFATDVTAIVSLCKQDGTVISDADLVGNTFTSATLEDGDIFEAVCTIAEVIDPTLTIIYEVDGDFVQDATTEAWYRQNIAIDNGVPQIQLTDESEVTTEYPIETTANKVTAFHETPDDTHYPSEKLVDDSLKEMKGVDYESGTLKTHEDRLDTLENDVTTEGSVLKSIKDNAENATYDNTDSGLSSTTLKTAIDETAGNVDNLAGTGRTIETVKGNADAIATLETTVDTNRLYSDSQYLALKAQADAQALEIQASRAELYNGYKILQFGSTDIIGKGTKADYSAIDVSANVVDGKLSMEQKGLTITNLVDGADIADSGTVSFNTVNGDKYFDTLNETIITGDGTEMSATNSSGATANMAIYHLNALGLDHITDTAILAKLLPYVDGTKNVGKMGVRVVGKNFCPTAVDEWEQGTIVSNTGLDSASTTNLRTKSGRYYRVKSGATVSGSLNGIAGTNYTFIMFGYDKNFNFVGVYFGANKTIGANVAYARWRIVKTVTVTPNEVETIKPQSEYSATVTPYEPYQEQLTFLPAIGNSLPNGVADSIKTVADGWEKVKKVYTPEAVASGVAVNTTNYPTAKNTGQWVNELTAGGTEIGVVGTDSTTGAGILRFELATPIVTHYDLPLPTSGKTIHRFAGEEKISLYGTGLTFSENVLSVLSAVKFVAGVMTDITSLATITTNTVTFSGVNATDVVYVKVEHDVDRPLGILEHTPAVSNTASRLKAIEDWIALQS